MAKIYVGNLPFSADEAAVRSLFAQHGTDLRGPMRAGADDGAMAEIIRNIWTQRTDRYSEQRVILRQRASADPKIEMNYIGG